MSDVPRIGAARTDLVRLIRKRAKEDFGDVYDEGYVKLGTSIERGHALTGRYEHDHPIRGTWIDAKIFVPDEQCTRCDKPIEPGKEIEVENDWDSPLCPSCAKTYHVKPKRK